MTRTTTKSAARAATLAAVVVALSGAGHALMAGAPAGPGHGPRREAAAPPKRDSVRIKMGKDTVTISFSKVEAKGRVYGFTIPYGKPFRIGGEYPTVLRTTMPLLIAGSTIKPGSYTLFAIPQELGNPPQCEPNVIPLRSSMEARGTNPWTLVLSSQHPDSSATYDETRDVFRVPMFGCQLYGPENRLTMRVFQNGMEAQMAMVWEEVQTWIDFRPIKQS